MADIDPLNEPDEPAFGEAAPDEMASEPAMSPPDTAAPSGSEGLSLETVMRIPVSVKIVLGSASMPVASLLKLGRGALIPLDRKIGEPVDVVVNGRVVARGDVVVMDDDPSRFGISLTEVVGPSGPDKRQLP